MKFIGAHIFDYDATFRGDVTIEGNLTVSNSVSQTISFGDNDKLKFGDGNDLEIFHDGSNSYVNHRNTGDLIIQASSDDKDIIFKSDDGSGGVTTYFYLDGASKEIRVNEEMQFEDDVKLNIGTGEDLTFKHNGTNSLITNSKGNLIITNQENDGDIILQADDGSGGDTAYLTLDGSATELVASKNLRFDQSPSYIFFNGNNTFVGELSNSGKLQLRGGGSNMAATVYVDSSGNMGLGTSVPSSKLDVRGTVQVGVDDTGHDVIFYGATSGRYMLWDESADRLRLTDNTTFYLGTGLDLGLFHNGSFSEIVNNTGDLYIKNQADDKDIIFFCDDGSGGTTEYFRLNGGLSSPYTNFPDNSTLSFGGSNDLRIYHDGTNNNINSINGNLNIAQYSDDSDIIFYSDDGSGGLAEYIRIDGSVGNTYAYKDIRFVDDVLAIFGTSGDSYIKHDGSNMTILNNTGNMAFYQATDDADMVFYCDDGSGGLTAYLTLDGGLGYTTVQKNMRFNDSTFLEVGASADLSLYHDGTDSYIKNSVGDLYIRNDADDKDIIFAGDDGSGGIATYFFLDGSQTRTQFDKDIMLIGGASYIFVDNSAGRMDFADGVFARFGTSGDLRISHDSNHSYISQEGTGSLFIRNTTNDQDIIFQSDDGSGGLAT